MLIVKILFCVFTIFIGAALSRLRDIICLTLLLPLALLTRGMDVLEKIFTET